MAKLEYSKENCTVLADNIMKALQDFLKPYCDDVTSEDDLETVLQVSSMSITLVISAFIQEAFTTMPLENKLLWIKDILERSEVIVKRNATSKDEKH